MKLKNKLKCFLRGHIVIDGGWKWAENRCLRCDRQLGNGNYRIQKKYKWDYVMTPSTDTYESFMLDNNDPTNTVFLFSGDGSVYRTTNLSDEKPTWELISYG